MNLIAFRRECKRLLGETVHAYDSSAIVDRLLCYRLYVSLVELRRGDLPDLSAEIHAQLALDLSRLIAGEPLQYVLEQSWFDDLDLYVDQRVLIPRPETEEMVLLAARAMPEAETVLDLCSGSGCIAFAIKKRIFKSRVIAVELDPGAVEVIGINADRTGLPVECVQGDLFLDSTEQQLPDAVDLILSNPPYVLHSESEKMSSAVVDFEPHLALFVYDHDPIVFYRRIAELSERKLVSGGKVWMEVNPGFASKVAELFAIDQFASSEVVGDMSGKQRFVCAEKA
jgi:release factor glutamine methyltransferase